MQVLCPYRPYRRNSHTQAQDLSKRTAPKAQLAAGASSPTSQPTHRPRDVRLSPVQPKRVKASEAAAAGQLPLPPPQLPLERDKGSWLYRLPEAETASECASPPHKDPASPSQSLSRCLRQENHLSFSGPRACNVDDPLVGKRLGQHSTQPIPSAETTDSLKGIKPHLDR